jgi:hypothetical protein
MLIVLWTHLLCRLDIHHLLRVLSKREYYKGSALKNNIGRISVLSRIAKLLEAKRDSWLLWASVFYGVGIAA